MTSTRRLNPDWNWHPQLPLENSPLFVWPAPTRRHRPLVRALLAETLDDSHHSRALDGGLDLAPAAPGAVRDLRAGLDRSDPPAKRPPHHGPCGQLAPLPAPCQTPRRPAQVHDARVRPEQPNVHPEQSGPGQRLVVPGERRPDLERLRGALPVGVGEQLHPGSAYNVPPCLDGGLALPDAALAVVPLLLGAPAVALATGVSPGPFTASPQRAHRTLVGTQHAPLRAHLVFQLDPHPCRSSLRTR